MQSKSQYIVVYIKKKKKDRWDFQNVSADNSDEKKEGNVSKEFNFKF